MPPPTTQQLHFDRLLWRHFSWHLWVGTAIWAGLVALISLYTYLEQRSSMLQDDFYNQNNLASDTFGFAGMLLLSGFVPALVGGLVRQPFLAALSRRAHSAGALVWQSLALFELLVCALALIPWPIAYNTFGLESFGRQLRVLFVLSLPWLASTGLASWRLASALSAAPAAEEAPNRPTRAN